MRAPIPEKLPADMASVADDLSRSADKMLCLKEAYLVLSRKYRGYRYKTYFHIFDFFKNDVDVNWRKSGFLHCTNLNNLLIALLVKSGHFKEWDIERRWTLIWYISPHEYLRVKIGDSEYVNVDLWGKAYGIDFGDYAHGLH